jgi:medium-chain acyl-[acyl-carrier-protein] hydrolase
MVEMIKEKEYFIHYYDTNQKLKLSISSLMNFFEDLAFLQSEDREIGMDYYAQKNVAWLLHQFEIRIKEYPKFKDKVVLRTIPTSFLRFYAHRSFDMFNESDDIIISADTIWIFVDMITRKPKSVTEDLYKGYCITPGKNVLPKLAEPRKLTTIDFEKEFRIRFSDIDVNKHVNNVSYVLWALEALPEELLQQKDIELVRIIFRKELIYGSKIKSCVQVLNEEGSAITLHSIVDNEGRDACNIEFHWR